MFYLIILKTFLILFFSSQLVASIVFISFGVVAAFCCAIVDGVFAARHIVSIVIFCHLSFLMTYVLSSRKTFCFGLYLAACYFLIILFVGEISFGKKSTEKPIMPVSRDGTNYLFITERSKHWGAVKWCNDRCDKMHACLQMEDASITTSFWFLLYIGLVSMARIWKAPNGNENQESPWKS